MPPASACGTGAGMSVGAGPGGGGSLPLGGERLRGNSEPIAAAKVRTVPPLPPPAAVEGPRSAPPRGAGCGPSPGGAAAGASGAGGGPSCARAWRFSTAAMRMSIRRCHSCIAAKPADTCAVTEARDGRGDVARRVPPRPRPPAGKEATPKPGAAAVGGGEGWPQARPRPGGASAKGGMPRPRPSGGAEGGGGAVGSPKSNPV